jgi:hypothetical protein
MKHLVTEITIDAPTDVVWDVLTDLAAYPEWNPFIVEVHGKPQLGTQLKNRLQPPGGKAMRFSPTVTAVDPDTKFEWLGRLGFRGVFDGRHIFELEATESGTRFVQREEFTGLLVPLFARSLDGKTKAGFEAMNRAIKERAEAQAHERG